MSFCGAALLMLSAHWFPSGKEGQLPTTGWFWAVRIRTRAVRQIKHLGARLQQGFWATRFPCPRTLRRSRNAGADRTRVALAAEPRGLLHASKCLPAHTKPHVALASVLARCQ